MRILLTVLVAAVLAVGMLPPEVGRAQDSAYRLVADWPTLPAGTFFGQQRGWPDQAARDAAATARRAAAGGGRGGARPAAPPIYGQGISGIAIDENDHIYVFNRGEQTVMVFDREGSLVRAGAERDMHGAPVAGGWLHSGEVDWDGNVWVVERMNHRILKFDPTLERALMQIGTTGEPGNDATHLDSPSGILFTREGNIVVTDGYGNNRVALYRPDGTFIKQVAKGRGGPEDKGAGTRRSGTCRIRARSMPTTTSISSTARTGASRSSTTGSTTSASSPTRAGTPGTSPSRGAATTASRTSPTTPASASTRSPSTTVGFSPPGASPAAGPASSTGSTAWPWTPRERSTRPTPTASACRSSCRLRLSLGACAVGVSRQRNSYATAGSRQRWRVLVPA